MTRTLKEMRIMVGGDTITLEDDLNLARVEPALDFFKRKETMRFAYNGTEYRVPFHAVDGIAVVVTTEVVDDKPDAYGC